MSEFLRLNPDQHVGVLQALQRGRVLGDGAMGTEIHAAGISYSECYEWLNITRPEIIKNIYCNYLRAGADVIRTNTFGANSVRLSRHCFEDRCENINLAAIRLAYEAMRDVGRNVFLAASVGPTGVRREELNTLKKQLVSDAYSIQVEALCEGVVDIICLETMGCIDEIVIALESIKKVATTMPVSVQVFVDHEQCLTDGTPIIDFGRIMKNEGVAVVGVNCCTSQESLVLAAEKLLSLGVLVTAAPNAGVPTLVNNAMVYPWGPNDFAEQGLALFEQGVSWISGCCGCGPAYVESLVSKVNANNAQRAVRNLERCTGLNRSSDARGQ